MDLYPLKFTPIFKYRIWGGNKLKTKLNKDYIEENIGESWEISGVKNNETFVSEGYLKGRSLAQLINTFKGDIIGDNVYKIFGDTFPLLIKFIDAKKPLSIQVHPSNEIAKSRHNSFGKNEMWYVMEAEDDAELIVGFDKSITKEEYEKHLKNGTILDVMHHENVNSGDTFYIPTGRVHAIGEGVMLAEIQQTSDITYRIYDYDRVDAKTGLKRELHNDLALDVIDYRVYESYKTHYDLNKNTSNILVHSPYFKTNIIAIEGHMTIDYSDIDSFVIYICVEGSLDINCNNLDYSLNTGETLLVPSNLNELKLKSVGAKILEVYYQ
ncbi:type I phosphomannose isomerase catalytic subunit [Seonamhaeicola aphaedonensis]|uniref:Phosphohexomutase n=1 Tax=Seonamhaeicola aphaedonensis TaxID=1461338 RepID=A0A3D9H8B1_9FLAO|nr:type I phosphomannose isomerase catalytic subunit [Seonamhaeicola aphaedonensis]RED45723.1 mannose-6-phosphate isomerase type 1 [Seonamhaeicola aphaedonensis]